MIFIFDQMSFCFKLDPKCATNTPSCASIIVLLFVIPSKVLLPGLLQSQMMFVSLLMFYQSFTFESLVFLLFSVPSSAVFFFSSSSVFFLSDLRCCKVLGVGELISELSPPETFELASGCVLLLVVFGFVFVSVCCGCVGWWLCVLLVWFW